MNCDHADAIRVEPCGHGGITVTDVDGEVDAAFFEHCKACGAYRFWALEDNDSPPPRTDTWRGWFAPAGVE